MARDSEGNYYLVGSHSGKTPGERDEHAKLIRFRLKTQPGTNGSLDAVAIDEGSVISWRLASPLIQALQHEGLNTKAVDERKIEGLAIRELPAGPDGRVRRELVIGLRQPDDLVRTFVADITVPPAPDAELVLDAPLCLRSRRARGRSQPADVDGVSCRLEGLPGRHCDRGRPECVSWEHALVRARQPHRAGQWLTHPGRQGLDVRGCHESRGVVRLAASRRCDRPRHGPPCGDL